MKIKKTKQKNYNLLDYNLIYSRVYLGLNKLSLYYLNLKYLRGFRNTFCIFELTQTKIYLKKVLKIIYEYHYSNGKILFIGFPELENDKFATLFQQTKHYYISQNTWVNSVILNRSQILQHLQQKTFYSISNKEKLSIFKNLNGIFNIKQAPDLIVIYNQTSESNAVKESISSKIPLITFLNSSDKSEQIVYKVPGGFQSKKAEKFCYFLLKSVLTLSQKKDIKNADFRITNQDSKVKKNQFSITKNINRLKKNLEKLEFWW